MPIRNPPIPEVIVVESYNGCYIPDSIELRADNKHDERALKTLPFATEFVRRNSAFVSRFLTGVSRSEGCWLWTRGKDAYGYGQITPGSYKPPMKTHRVAWLVFRGPIPAGAHVLHTCDVRHCVNPDHLFLGDQAANMKDAAQKYRLTGNCKLSDTQVAEIRRRYVRGNGAALAHEFGVSLVSICRIAKGTQRRPRPAKEGVA